MPPSRWRLPNSTATSTQIQANIGADPAVCRHRRSIEFSPREGRMSRTAQIRRDASRAAQLQAGDLAFGYSAQGTNVSASYDDGGEARDEADKGAQRRPRLARLAGQQSDDELGEGHERAVGSISNGKRRAPVSVAIERMR